MAAGSGRLLAALLVVMLSARAEAAEVRVLTAGAMKAVVLAMVPDFEARTGHKVTLDNDTAGGLKKRIGGSEPVDLAIITPKVVDELIADGKLSPGSRVDLAKVGIGVAVKTGTPLPDIATVEDLKRTLLAAKTVAYSDPKAGASSGIYFDGLLERLGIASEVRAKAKLRAGGYVAEYVVSGEADVAVHQISEILPVQGATLVGPLPKEVQHYTVYALGIGAAAREPAAARALAELLGGPSATRVLLARGMERP